MAPAPASPPVRRPWWRRPRPPRRRLRFTTSGKWYIGFTFAIGLAAINNGNNLLFLVLGLLLGGIVIGGVLSESVLLDLEVERVVPREVRAGRPALVGLRLTSARPRAASYAVQVRDLAGAAELGRAFFLKVEAGASREAAYRWTPARRGRVEPTEVELSTRFPFGLFEKSYRQRLPGELVVFPREVPAPREERRRSAPPGELPESRAGAGGDFFALRDARPDDDARHIHWPTSARREVPALVERERERTRRLAVVVDNRVGGPAEPARLDAAAELCAALVRRALEENSEFAFAASGVTVAPGTGLDHERRVLRALALLGPAAQGPAPATFAHAETRRVPALGPEDA